MKTIIRRAAALALALTLSLPPALATGSEPFPKTHSYPGFTDVPAGAWYASAARVVCETGLMQGTGQSFAPDVTLTNGETAAIAARVRAALTGESIPAGIPGQPWYQSYVDYLGNAGISVPAPSAYATRQGFFALLAAVLPESQLAPLNTITALPDTQDSAVLRFYNAGILTGVDPFGTFAGNQPLSRAECAAMVARVADPSLRRHFTPAGQVPASPYPTHGVVMAVDGDPVTYDQFQDILLSLMEEVNKVYLDYGLTFDWEGHYGMEGWRDYFKAATKSSLAAEKLVAAQAGKLGCSPDDLALTLFGPPSQEELAAYARENGMDRTLPGADEEIAELILGEKLNGQVGAWVEAAKVETTPLYDQIDPKVIWEIYH